MKHKSQQKRKKKRSSSSSSVKPNGEVTASDGSKKDLEEERKKVGDDESQKQKNVIESLLEAFPSVSLEEATVAYKEANEDLNKAAEILSDLFDMSGSSGQETGSTSEYGAGSSSSCSEDLTRDVWFKGSNNNKSSRVIAATGMVSSVIGKDYMKAKPVYNKESKELGKKAADRDKAEQFLSSMLGDDCDLSLAVVRDVLCQCGYDVDMALNVLLDMSSSSTDDSFSVGRSGVGFSDSLAESSFDTDTSESELFWGGYSRRDYAKALMSSGDPFATSQGSCENGLPQEVLESLFNVPQGTKNEAKTMSWRNVAKKMESFGIDASSSSGEESPFVNGDGYHDLRKGANDQWNVTKTYYQKAAEAYSKGGRAHAAYLSDKGRTATKLAQRADERASQDIFVARNKGIENVITIDLHGQHVKQAMKLLKLHLLFGSYVPSIQTLRVITGCGSHGFGKSKVKQTVMKLLEREGVRYCEENRGTLLIQVEGCNKEFSFLDTESDTE